MAKRKTIKATCPHPTRRLFTWWVRDVLCVCCCECGAVLQGGAS